jgi:hypothetical protein
MFGLSTFDIFRENSRNSRLDRLGDRIQTSSATAFSPHLSRIELFTQGVAIGLK